MVFSFFDHFNVCQLFDWSPLLWVLQCCFDFSGESLLVAQGLSILGLG